MARVLIVGCGCRGQALARELVTAGHAVRGTTRTEERLPDIEAAGAEAVIADPDRLGTLMPQLVGVSVICWLLGSAGPEVNGPRLRSLLEHLVDTPVRGFVYDAPASAGGAALVREVSAAWRIPAEIVEPGDSLSAAVARLL